MTWTSQICYCQQSPISNDVSWDLKKLSHLDVHTHTHTVLAMAFRSCTEDKCKRDCRVKGPPPAFRARLQLRGHRQLEREDQTAPPLSWRCVVTHMCTTSLVTTSVKHTSWQLFTPALDSHTQNTARTRTQSQTYTTLLSGLLGF